MSSAGDFSEDDAELKDVVLKELESSGVLAKVKAELMASVFLTLEKGHGIKKIPFRNESLKDFLDTADGELCYSIIKEFLAFHDLPFSGTTLMTETGMNTRSVSGGAGLSRDGMMDELNLSRSNVRPSYSILRSLVQQCKSSQTPRSYAPSSNFTPVLSKDQIENIKNLFNNHDKDSDGFLSQQEMTDLLCELCPQFSGKVVSALCESELNRTSSVVSLVNTKVSLAQFNSIYQRFYTSCYTVISDNSKVSNVSVTSHGGSHAKPDKLSDLSPTQHQQHHKSNDYSFEFDEEVDDENVSVSSSNKAAAEEKKHESQSNGLIDDDFNDLLELGDDLSTDRTISEAQAPHSFDFAENIK